MAKLSDLLNRTARIVFDFAGEPVWIDYRIESYTVELDHEFRKYQDEKNHDRMSEILCRMIAAWDIQGEDGRMLPVTPENMKMFNIMRQIGLFRAIEVHMIDPNSGKPSDAGSVTTDSPASGANAPTGTPSSPALANGISTPPTSSAAPNPAPVFVG